MLEIGEAFFKRCLTHLANPYYTQGTVTRAADHAEQLDKLLHIVLPQGMSTAK